ncbi:hypothetical protein KKG90_10135 [Candidatus Bipolaricaulota bacterium]|nr:hypothetical protein [Candidatus Bipolaricaulota bacterium]
MSNDTPTQSSDWKATLTAVLTALALLSGTATSILKGWEEASYVFVALVVLAAAVFLFQRVRSAKRSATQSFWQIGLPVTVLVIVVVLAGTWGWWAWNRPPVRFVGIRVNHDIALEMMLGDYGPVAQGDIDLSAAILAFRSGDTGVIAYVQSRIEQGISLPPVALEITLENTTDRSIAIHETQIRTIQACGLVDCLVYGDLPELTKPGYASLCPWVSEAELSNMPPLSVAGSASLAESDPVQILTVYLANDADSQTCRPAEYGRVAVALYEIEVAVICGARQRAVTYERMVIAIPDLVYSLLGQGEVWQERTSQLDDLGDCQLANATRAKRILSVANERWTDPWIVQRLLPEYARIGHLIGE